MLGIGATVYGVLSRGLLGGSKPGPTRDLRSHLPRFAGDNLEHNARAVAVLQQIAAERGASAAQLAIAWVLTKNPTVLPLIGARKRAQLAESLGALHVSLPADDMSRIEAALPSSAIAGTRYDAHQMKVLNSEK